MTNIGEFNAYYFHTIKDCACGDISLAATVFNADLSQVAEVVKMSRSTIQYLSCSTVAIAEPTFIQNDLTKSVDIGNQEIISILNHEYLSMIRHLSVQSERLAQLTTRIPLDMNRMIKSLTAQEIRRIAASNKLLFRFALPAKSLAKANSAEHRKSSSLFINHIALMTSSFAMAA